ncbi:unnamed protein product [Heligmosomoides polygyrus]|uniref:Uncharacterized protein n=1 Tax=Heligmosomoides polygyrus TaxID=6339 RepID=A0A183FL86_HELPZ|nr:unnamed protein product [Heligmosomoides polygyrus]
MFDEVVGSSARLQPSRRQQVIFKYSNIRAADDPRRGGGQWPWVRSCCSGRRRLVERRSRSKPANIAGHANTVVGRVISRRDIDPTNTVRL